MAPERVRGRNRQPGQVPGVAAPYRASVADDAVDCNRTCRVWDLRRVSSSTKILPANLASVRSVRFSAGGEVLVVAEAADFVHLYDCANDLSTSQQIDFFGETAGADISNDASTLFIGISDNVYGSMLQYSRRPVGLMSNIVI